MYIPGTSRGKGAGVFSYACGSGDIPDPTGVTRACICLPARCGRWECVVCPRHAENLRGCWTPSIEPLNWDWNAQAVLRIFLPATITSGPRRRRIVEIGVCLHLQPVKLVILGFLHLYLLETASQIALVIESALHYTIVPMMCALFLGQSLHSVFDHSLRGSRPACSLPNYSCLPNLSDMHCCTLLRKQRLRDGQ